MPAWLFTQCDLRDRYRRIHSSGTAMSFRPNPTRLLATEELAPLTRVSAGRSARSVLLTWGVIAVALATTVLHFSWPLVLVAIVVIGTQQHALFILSHEATHFRMFEQRGLNEGIGRVCATAAGLSMCTYRVIHRLHHSHLYTAADPDMALHGGYPRGAWYLVKKLLKDLSGLTALKTYRYFFGSPAQNTASSESREPLEHATPSLRRAARNDRRIVIAV